MSGQPLQIVPPSIPKGTHTLVFNNKLYMEAPKIRMKRSSPFDEPARKIQKVIHITPEAMRHFKSKGAGDPGLKVTHDRDEVYITYDDGNHQNDVPMRQVPARRYRSAGC